jgi:hypothetical protein
VLHLILRAWRVDDVGAFSVPAAAAAAELRKEEAALSVAAEL